jgi:CRISPR/Cas system-associated exonuclease Cas4 (RecB family)
MKDYAQLIYDAAADRSPVPTVYEIFTEHPTALGVELSAGLENATALRRLCHLEMRDTIKTWFSAFYGRRLHAPPRIEMHGIDMTGLGTVDTEHGRQLLDAVMVTCKGWNEGILPTAVASSAIVKARAAGLDAARVLMVNQNSLSWSFWEVEVPVPSYSENLFSAFRGRAQAFAQAFGGEKSSSVPGVENYPVVETRHRPDEERLAEIVKAMALEESGKRKGGVISPSEISITLCDRRIGYALQKAPRVDAFPLDLYRVFAYGTAIHNLIQRLLLGAVPGLVDEMLVVNQGLRIQGSADVGDLEDRVLLEIKSMSTHQHTKLKSPKTEHKKQATIYARAGDITFKTVVYLYVDKDRYAIKALPTKASSSDWHKIAARCESINKTLARHELPDRIDNPSECGSCPFGYACKPGEYGNRAPESLVLAAARSRRTRSAS